MAVGWDAMAQADTVCELEILVENDSSRIIIRFVLPHILFHCHTYSLIVLYLLGREVVPRNVIQ